MKRDLVWEVYRLRMRLQPRDSVVNQTENIL